METNELLKRMVEISSEIYDEYQNIYLKEINNQDFSVDNLKSLIIDETHIYNYITSKEEGKILLLSLVTRVYNNKKDNLINKRMINKSLYTMLKRSYDDPDNELATSIEEYLENDLDLIAFSLLDQNNDLDFENKTKVKYDLLITKPNFEKYTVNDKFVFDKDIYAGTRLFIDLLDFPVDAYIEMLNEYFANKVEYFINKILDIKNDDINNMDTLCKLYTYLYYLKASLSLLDIETIKQVKFRVIQLKRLISFPLFSVLMEAFDKTDLEKVKVVSFKK